MNKFTITLIFIIGISAVLFFTLFKTEDKLELHFLDVGQADAILIRTPQGQNILIDGGADNKLLSEVARVLPWWERQIDYVVISHYHADHIMGLPELLNKYSVKYVLTSNHQPDDFLYQILMESFEQHQTPVQIVEVGEKFQIDDDLYWQILLADDYNEDYNENSVVIRLSYQNRNFLFMGDLGIPGEEKLLSIGFDLSAEVLKVGHHGSRYASSQEFLEAVQPEICIIQSGLDNKFGHPHQEAIERLEAIGCQVLDNQVLGAIHLFY